jgi:predicted aldo/keto reductase-like oxidoreductase
MKKTRDELSILGFGAMRLPQKQGKIVEDLATRQIRMAIDKGINFIDTAWPYHNGMSETFLGRALADGYRQRIKLSTKLPYWLTRNREDMQRILSAQLDKLKTDHIDYYGIHAVNGETWKTAKECGVIEFLHQAKKEGRIINAGFSSHGNKDSLKSIVDDYDWEFCMIQYNYLDEHNQAGKEGLQYAAARDLGVIIMEPLRGGKLADKIPPSVLCIWNEAEKKRTPAEWALRWIWNHPEVTVVLSGMNDESQIEENIRIADEAYANSLTASELQRISRVEKVYRKLMRVGCTGCGYCMPCPAGVNIPICFEIYNGLQLSERGWKAKIPSRINYLNHLAPIPGMRSSNFASLCTDCRRCTEECPQGLPVSELIKEVAKEFEDTIHRVLYLLMKTLLRIQRRNALRSGRKAADKATCKSSQIPG